MAQPDLLSPTFLSSSSSSSSSNTTSSSSSSSNSLSSEIVDSSLSSTIAQGCFCAAKRGAAKLLRYIASLFPAALAPAALPFYPEHPLLAAAGRGHVAVVELLLRHGWPVDSAAPDDGATGVFVAAQQGKVAALRMLLERGGDANVALVPSGSTPLMAACQSGRVEAVRLLLRQPGIAVNATTQDTKASALHVAVQTGDLELVNVLLCAGADPFLKDNDGLTPLVVASTLFGTTHPIVMSLLIHLRSQLKK